MDGLTSRSSNSNSRKKGNLKKAISMSSEPSPQSENDIPRGSKKKTARFDEDNIKETYHPSNKDYGFDSIAEPNTPYEREVAPVDAQSLAEQLLRVSQDQNDVDENATCEMQQPGTSSSQSIEFKQRTSNASANSATSASISITSSTSMTFEERRKKHVQAEFIVAMQASPKTTDDQETSKS